MPDKNDLKTDNLLVRIDQLQSEIDQLKYNTRPEALNLALNALNKVLYFFLIHFNHYQYFIFF